MAKALIIGSMVLCTSAIVLVIVSLATSNWMTACFSPKQIIEQVVGDVGSIGSSSLDSQAPNLNPSATYCINSGLFGIEMIQTDQLGTNTIKLPVRNPQVHTQIAAAFLIIGILLVFPALIFFGLCIFGDSFLQEKNLSLKLLKNIGLVLLIVGSLFWGASGVAYVIPQSEYVNNPLSYILDAFRGLGFGGGNLIPPSFQPNGGVPPEVSDTGAISYPSNSNNDLSSINSNFPAASGNFDPSFFNSNIQNSNAPVSNGNTGGGFSESFGNTDFNNHHDTDVVVDSVNYSENDSVNTLDILRKFLRPEFGFSFYLAWVAFALGLLATVLVGVGFKSILKETRNGQPVSKA